MFTLSNKWASARIMMLLNQLNANQDYRALDAGKCTPAPHSNQKNDCLQTTVFSI